MKYSELPEFQKEFKKYSRKYRTLPTDLNNFKKITNFAPVGTGKHFNVIYSGETTKIIKARFFCRCLRGSSMRIVYCFFCEKNQIQFIELYFKGNKENENRERIKDYLKKLN